MKSFYELSDGSDEELNQKRNLGVTCYSSVVFKTS